jgi:hypothetical protein
MKHIKLFENFINEGSGEILKPKRNEWIKIDPKDHPELSNEFFDLISTAYKEVGGFVNLKEPKDVFADPDWTYWEGIDIHGSPDLDLIFFGKNTKYGVKYTGVGHDGEKDTKKLYLDSRGKDLKEPGFYLETSGKLSAILINKYNVPVVNSKEKVEKVLGKNVEWLGKNDDADRPGDGWYERMIRGEKHRKILLGKPKI